MSVTTSTCSYKTVVFPACSMLWCVISSLLLSSFTFTEPPTFHFPAIDLISLLASWTIPLPRLCKEITWGALTNTDTKSQPGHSNWPQNVCKAPWGLGYAARIEDTLLFNQVNDIASLEKGMAVSCFSLHPGTSLGAGHSAPLWTSYQRVFRERHQYHTPEPFVDQCPPVSSLIPTGLDCPIYFVMQVYKSDPREWIIQTLKINTFIGDVNDELKRMFHETAVVTCWEQWLT